MDSSVVVLPSSSLRITSKRYANKPCSRSARNQLPSFSSHWIPPARKQAHNSHTRAAVRKIYSRLEAVLLIAKSQCRVSSSAKRYIKGGAAPFPHRESRGSRHKRRGGFAVYR